MRNTLDQLKDYKLILASQSPRRQMLLEGLDLKFEIRIANVDEVYPDEMPFYEVPKYLSKLKADAFEPTQLQVNEIVITADTIVVLDDKIIGKPRSREEAINTITALSGNKHLVITGVCLTSKSKQKVFAAQSEVHFRQIRSEDIQYYVENYKPLDKAGAYGIQEWIGYIGIDRIEGSFYNVMGLPTQLLYEELIKFTANENP